MEKAGNYIANYTTGGPDVRRSQWQENENGCNAKK